MKLVPHRKIDPRKRALAIRNIEAHLERTTWSKGIYMQRLSVPGARPGQIRAAARKLFDRLQRDARILAAKQGGAL